MCSVNWVYLTDVVPGVSTITELLWLAAVDCVQWTECIDVCACIEESIYTDVTEEYVNSRMREQVLDDDQWSSLTNDVVRLLQGWVYKRQDSSHKFSLNWRQVASVICMSSGAMSNSYRLCHTHISVIGCRTHVIQWVNSYRLSSTHVVQCRKFLLYDVA